MEGVALGISRGADGTPARPSRRLSSRECALCSYKTSTLASSSLFLFLLPRGICWKALGISSHLASCITP